MLASRSGRDSRRAPPRSADVRALPRWTSVHGSCAEGATGRAPVDSRLRRSSNRWTAAWGVA